MKYNIYLCQVNNQYGQNVFLPYSVGLLRAYCESLPEIRESFTFPEFIFLRDRPDEIVHRVETPRVFGMSCYIWNWEFNKVLARRIKERYPDCLVVAGGPQVPGNSEHFFRDLPFVDLLVHYEGEVTFAEILLESLRQDPDYTRVAGCSVRVDGNRCHKTPPRPRLAPLDSLPSPYLTGIFDNLLRQPYSFHASQETHRGCPYACTFCDWGSAVYTKVRAFDEARLVAEFEWCGRRQIDLLYNCDANYGLLRRDLALTEKLVRTKHEFGFPKQFRAAYAKKSDDRVFEIARLLNRAGMSKGVTLSFQSMDPHTLDVIKRTNIRVQDFKEFMRRYRREGIPTYTELIMGLPGETYESFVRGIDEILRSGQHEALNIYMCTVLPNSEMSQPWYLEKHGIRSVRMPILLHHSTPRQDEVQEYSDIVVETSTLSEASWRRMYLFSWAIQCFHCLGLTQYLAVLLHRRFGLAYNEFYEALLRFAEDHPKTLVASQRSLVEETMNRALAGGPWEIVIPRFGPVTWPTEEATFLNIVCEKPRFYGEMAAFVRTLADARGFALDDELLNQVLTYQASMIVDPFAPAEFEVPLAYNLHAYFAGALLDEPVRLVRGSYVLTVEGGESLGCDLETYARRVVWYGRKGGTTQYRNVRERPLATEREPASTTP